MGRPSRSKTVAPPSPVTWPQTSREIPYQGGKSAAGAGGCLGRSYPRASYRGIPLAIPCEIAVPPSKGGIFSFLVVPPSGMDGSRDPLWGGAEGVAFGGGSFQLRTTHPCTPPVEGTDFHRPLGSEDHERLLWFLFQEP
jgi:hypothetical protein